MLRESTSYPFLKNTSHASKAQPCNSQKKKLLNFSLFVQSYLSFPFSLSEKSKYLCQVRFVQTEKTSSLCFNILPFLILQLEAIREDLVLLSLLLYSESWKQVELVNLCHKKSNQLVQLVYLYRPNSTQAWYKTIFNMTLLLSKLTAAPLSVLPSVCWFPASSLKLHNLATLKI